MLAPNYKTAVELGIPEKVHAGLIKILHMLETGKILSLPNDARWFRSRETIDRLIQRMKYFYMGEATTNYDCGSAGCFIGWLQSPLIGLSFEEVHEAHTANAKLWCLFFPGAQSISCRDTERGAEVLRTYLTTGKVIW